MQRAIILLWGSVALTCGIFIGTISARLPAPAPVKTTSFLIESTPSSPVKVTPASRVNAPSLSGVIRNEEGAPIPGALVSLSERETTTSDHLGRFSFTQLTPGLVHLQVKHPDYFLFHSEPIQTVEGDVLSESITLQRPHVVSVQVTNSRKQPLAEIEIIAPEQQPLFTDLLGEVFLALPKGQATSARVKAVGFQPMLMLLSGEDKISVALPRPASVVGELLGAPAQATLLFLPTKPSNITSSASPVLAYQSFTTQGLLPGPYQVWAKTQSDTWPLQEITLNEGENRVNIKYVAPPSFLTEECEEGFAPLSSVERQDGALVIQKNERDLIAGDRIVAIDGVSLSSDEAFTISWVGARGSVARLTIERPSKKRFLFVSVPRTFFHSSCSSD